MILQKTRIIVADDHRLFRAGLVRMLSSFGNIEVLAEAEDAASALAAVTGQEADLLTLDLSMPGASGVALIDAIRQCRPHLPILVISMHDEPALVRQALRAGATGYVSKVADPETLRAAIERTRAHRPFISPELAKGLALAADEEALQPLTPREIQVLRLIASGVALVDIAERLGLSPKTVSTHKANIMAKLGATNNAELIRFAFERKLCD